MNWESSKVRYEIARALGRRHAPRSGFWVSLRRLYWIFIRGYEYEICNRCGRPVGKFTGSWWEAEEKWWILVNGQSEGVLCPPCFTRACEAKGFNIHWRTVIDPWRSS